MIMNKLANNKQKFLKKKSILIEELCASELRYRRLFESAKDGILILDAETGKIVDVNPFLIDLLGYSKKDFFEKSIWEIGSFHDIYENKEKFIELQKKEYVRYDDLPLVTSVGQVIHVEFVSNVYLSNKIKVIQCNIRDNTDNRNKLNEIKFQAELINNIGQAIIATDLFGKVNFWNNAAEKLYGWKASEAIGQNIINLTPAIQSKEQASEIMKNLSEGKSWTGEFYVKRKDGSSFPAFVTDTPIFDLNGQLTGIIGVSSDISQRKQLESDMLKAKEQAEESDRLKSAFLANMSHEIRTPMNGILGFAELLKEPNLTGDDQQYFIQNIEISGLRMLNIINDIVSISKIESGTMETYIYDTNINEQVEFVYNLFKLDATKKKLKLTFKNALPDKASNIKTDNDKLFSILSNLVKNAIKYTDEGSIEFGYKIVEKQHTATLEFYVKDTGIGIPKNKQEAVFERFIQVDIENKMARQGAGLGLAIAKAYVEMLNGKIWVESEEGVGSIFYFTIPYNIELHQNDVFENEVQLEAGVKNLKILIAEDDETSQELISIYLKSFSKEILRAITGIEAVEMCRANPDIDLILMDIQMPDLNGYDATQQIRQFNKDVIIIAQTAFGLTGDREKTIEAGCNDYISKPIDRLKLHDLIQKYFKK